MLTIFNFVLFIYKLYLLSSKYQYENHKQQNYKKCIINK